MLFNLKINLIYSKYCYCIIVSCTSSTTLYSLNFLGVFLVWEFMFLYYMCRVRADLFIIFLYCVATIIITRNNNKKRNCKKTLLARRFLEFCCCYCFVAYFFFGDAPTCFAIIIHNSMVLSGSIVKHGSGMHEWNYKVVLEIHLIQIERHLIDFEISCELR